MEPADETQRLIAEIKAGTYQPAADAPAPSPPAARPAQPARLPILQINGFRSGGPVNVARYLIDGFRLDLIASLVGFREWVVVDGEQDPQSTAGGHQPGPAKRTDPDYHLEATCFDNAGAIRLIVTLKERATQQAIAQRTAAALDVYLSADRVARRIGGTDGELRAFDLWLRGQSLLKNWDPETERDAERLFRDVVAMMPSFAPAYSSLANIYNSRHIIMPGYFRQRELEHEALRLGRKAVELDPLDAHGQLTLAWSYLMADAHDRGELHFELARKLKPADPVTLISAAQGLALCQRKDEALREGLIRAGLPAHDIRPVAHQR